MFAPWKLNILALKTNDPSVLICGFIQILSGPLWIRRSFSLAAQISEQLPCIHSGDLKAKKQFRLYMATDGHFIDMVPLPKCRRNGLYPISETCQFMEFICLQKSLLLCVKGCAHCNFYRGYTFVLCRLTLIVVRTVSANLQRKGGFAFLRVFVIYAAFRFMTCRTT